MTAIPTRLCIRKAARRAAAAQFARLVRIALAGLMVLVAVPQGAWAGSPTVATPTALTTPASVTVPGATVIDYSAPFTSGTPARLKRAGIGVVIRYVGAAKWKSLSRSEANALRSAGIDIAAVYETKANWMLAGRGAGASAAKKARASIVACGGPKKPFVWFACDVGTKNFSAVNACLRGAASVLGADHVGIYGSYAVCESALKSGYATKAWQTEAWSGGKVLRQAVLYQAAHRVNGTLGVDYDSNFVRGDDFGQWGYAAPAAVTWAAQSVQTSETLRGVDVVGAAAGWAVGDAGTVVHTADGGATWAAQSTSATRTLTAVDFTDAGNGWAVGEAGTLLHTADGGATWSAQATTATADLASVSFANATTGWAVGSSGTILHTADAGATWAAQSTPTSAALSAVRFADATTGWAVGSGGTVLRTTDGGATWTRPSTPTSATLTSVDFMDAETGWAVGSAGTVLRTSNGGVTWTKQPAPTTATLTSVDFADDIVGWAVGDGGVVLHTTNGGATWAVQPVATTTGLKGVRFTDPITGWAVGEGGTVLRATAVQANPFATVAGVVTDAKTGAPISGASFTIGSQRSGATAPDGSFVAARLKPGTYKLTFSNPIYVTQTSATVVLSAGRRGNVRMRLTPKTATSLTRPASVSSTTPAGQLVSLAATISPSAAATSAVTVISGSHYEQKTVTRKVKGKKRKYKVWYWRARFALPMTPGASGSLLAQTRLAAGTWRVEVKFPGAATFLPSTVGARVYVR